MKKLILKGFALLTLAAGVSSCGNDFLETDYYSGLDIETSLNSVSNLCLLYTSPSPRDS